jgi:hypothetical protein
VGFPPTDRVGAAAGDLNVSSGERDESEARASPVPWWKRIAVGAAAVGLVAAGILIGRATADSGKPAACAPRGELEQRNRDAKAVYDATATATTIYRSSGTIVNTRTGVVSPAGTPLVEPADRGPALEAWKRASAVVAIYAEQNPSCFTATERAEIEAAYLAPATSQP